ncbi:hypothetical protein NQZ68_032799 [Dissostichus eleginoides]|nr:hypothetical protein NQZ68_032799 [Dissostichus eleginoides]
MMFSRKSHRQLHQPHREMQDVPAERATDSSISPTERCRMFQQKEPQTAPSAPQRDAGCSSRKSHRQLYQPHREMQDVPAERATDSSISPTERCRMFQQKEPQTAPSASLVKIVSVASVAMVTSPFYTRETFITAL